MKIENLRFDYLTAFQIICRFVVIVGDFRLPEENADDSAEYVLEAMLAVIDGLTDAPEVD